MKTLTSLGLIVLVISTFSCSSVRYRAVNGEIKLNDNPEMTIGEARAAATTTAFIKKAKAQAEAYDRANSDPEGAGKTLNVLDPTRTPAPAPTSKDYAQQRIEEIKINAKVGVYERGTKRFH